MAFTDTASVRNHLQLHDTDLAPDAWIAQQVDDAHAEIVTQLADAYLDSDESALAVGETEITAAGVLRGLANRASAEDRNTRTGDFNIDTRGRAAALETRARLEEQRGWARLAPYLKSRAGAFRFAVVEPVEPGDADFDSSSR